MLDDLSAGLLAADHRHSAAVGILLLRVVSAVEGSGRSRRSLGREPHGEDVPQGADISAAGARNRCQQMATNSNLNIRSSLILTFYFILLFH